MTATSPSTEFDKMPNGYPRLAALQAKEPEYMIIRRFRSLNAQTLLFYQAELTALEDQLERLNSDVRNGPRAEDLKSYPSFVLDNKRRSLVLKIRKVLREYNTAVLQFQGISSIPSPAHHHASGLKRWLRIADPITDISMNYLEKRSVCGEFGRAGTGDYGELLSLNQDADSWIGIFLRHSWLKFLFIQDMIYSPNRAEAFIFFNSLTIDAIVNAIAVICAVLLTVAAIVTLHWEARKGGSLRLGLIGLFTALIAAVLALAGAKKSEVFIGTFGFVAVLVVFVSGESDEG